MGSIRDSSSRVVKIGREVERGLYESVVLSRRRRRDASGTVRPCTTDLLCQEVVRQVLALPAEEQRRIRKRLGTTNRYPACDVAVRTR